MKQFFEKNFYISCRILILILAFLTPVESISFDKYSTVLYFKTDGDVKEIKYLGSNNEEKHAYQQEDLNVNNDTYTLEIENSFYGEKVQIKLTPNTKGSSTNFHIGFLVKIEDYFLEIQDPELSVLGRADSFSCNEETTHIEVNETYSEEVKYCKNIDYLSEYTFTVIIPFNKYRNCFESCKECSFFGDESAHNCSKCNNSAGYYFKEGDYSKNCFTNNTIEEGYFLDEENNIFKKCSTRCLTCSKYEEECLKCNNEQNYHFHPENESFCIKTGELINVNYYLDPDEDKYKICNERCFNCSGPDETNCISCNNSKGFYFKENDNSHKCYSKDDIDDGYFIDLDNNIFKKCNERCFSCDQLGNDTHSNCTKCLNNEYHFDPIIPNHCIKEDELPDMNYFIDISNDIYIKCHEACIGCSGPNEDKCTDCNNTNGFYLKENDNSHKCYSKDDIGDGYFIDLDNNIFKKCNERCFSCEQLGNDTHSNCTKCLNNEYHFDPIIPNHCIKEDELPDINYYFDTDDDIYKLCYETCLKCSGPNETDCISCNNTKGLYFKEDDIVKICHSIDEIENGYYLDLNNNLIKKCNSRCLSCNQSGTESYSNCIECLDDNYHFDPYKPNHCIKEVELPNPNYYVDPTDNIYKICYHRCLRCSGPNETECTECYNSKNYFFKEGDIIPLCYSNEEIEEGYYLDSPNNLIKKCNERCLSCNRGGTNTNSNCIKCVNDTYHFDPTRTYHCLREEELPSVSYYLDSNTDKFKKCNISCLTCYGPNNDNCILCNNNGGYYYKENNESQICYSNGNIEIGYYLDRINNLYRRCNKRCLKCNEGGSDIESNCLECNNSLNYHFDPIIPKHCLTYEELININYYLDSSVDKFKICNYNCSTCQNPYKCTLCNNTKGYYFIENDLSGICYNSITIAVGYYLNLTDNLYKLCNSRCYSCIVGGIDSESNCTRCKNDNNYHFAPFKQNHCIKINELPNNSFYLETSLDQYKICHESCLTCTGPSRYNCTSCNGQTFFETEFYPNQCLKLEEIPINYYSIYSSHKFTYYKCHISCRTCLIGGINNCQTCNVSGGYYPVEEKPGFCLIEEETPIKYYFDRLNSAIKKCAPNCAICTKGYDETTQEMNCDICIAYTYFQNTSSTNCIPKPETRFYIDIHNGHETLFPCYPSCLTCNIGGDSDINNCLSCISEYYFDDEEPRNCVDDDLNCAIGCAKCYKNTTDPIYGVLSADKMCRRCSHKMGYYPLEKYSKDQFYVSCYPFNKSPLNYIYDEKKKLHTLCYKTCKTCFKVGDNLNHSCTSCENNYIFIDEEPYNCFPQCLHYYYYNKYKQYKCTEADECPLEYPFLIANKSKCVDNCYSDPDFNLMFKNECFQKCPEGTSAYLYRYNGEFTAQCVNSDDFLSDKECDLDIKVSKLTYSEITEEILVSYGEEYVHQYPVANSYVTSYLSPESDTMNKYLIVLYKLEKCPKQKVEGFIPIGLDECIDKIKTKFTIMQNVVVQIFYVIRKSTPPQISYYLYHPETGEKLDLTICSGSKLAIKTSIFDNGNVNEELVKYFSNLNINIFDIKDPFFTDICFNYDQEGNDVPLDDRVKLFYQNITLCEDGCSYVGINLNTYEVECSCDLKNENHDEKDENIKNLLDNPLSNEVFGVLTNSNIEVLKCIKKAFNIKLMFKNYGGLMIIGLIFIQIICTIFLKIQMRTVERFIYTFISEIKNPPKRKTSLIKFESQNNKNENNNVDNNDKDRISKASKDIIINDVTHKENNEQEKIININNNTVKKEISISNNKRKRTHNIKNNKSQSRNINYNLIKQGSLVSTSSLLNTKDKYTLVKKGTLPYSTQYTNFISKEKNNSPNKSGSELNIININSSNNSNGSSGSGERENRMNSGESVNGLDKLEELNRDKENDISSEEEKKKDFFKERERGVGTYLDEIDLEKEKPKRYKTHVNSFDNKNNIILDNSESIENGMSSGTFRDNIPINDLEDPKSITIYSRKQKPNLMSSIHNNIEIVKTKRNSAEITTHQDINILRKQLKKEIISQIREHQKQKKEKDRIRRLTLVSYEHKEYDEKQLNELDYEEAVIYDKRNFCQMLWFSLKEKQTLINTFFSSNNLKPFPMKLLVLIFSFSCYFVINGFLYNEEYVSTKLENKGSKTFYEYISDSIERILYTSIVGGIISFIIGILFNTEKKIDTAMNKYIGNKILLKGEIAKIFRISKIIILCFIIIQFLLMILFTIYIFCFCYVYPNNKLDWFESSLIVIGIIQIFSCFTCFLFTFIKYLGIKFQLEFCFKINSYFEDNL